MNRYTLACLLGAWCIGSAVTVSHGCGNFPEAVISPDNPEEDPLIVGVGENYFFADGGSSDPLGGEIVRWCWYDGEEDEYYYTDAPSWCFNPSSTGEYEIRLYVKNDEGVWSDGWIENSNPPVFLNPGGYAVCCVYVVDISFSVSASKCDCYEGGQIGFSAVEDQGSDDFPAGQPVWTASVGSFVGGNTGPNVTWKAPNGSGGTATITATCGSSSEYEAVTYVKVDIGESGGDLLRSTSDYFSASIQPAGYAVTFDEDSFTSPVLQVEPLGGIFLEVDNVINSMDLQAHVDDALAAVEAILPGGDIKVLYRTYNLKKEFSDWADAVVVPDGEDLYDYTADYFADTLGAATYANAQDEGFNSVIAGFLRDDVETAVSSVFDTANPFPGSSTNSVVSESWTCTWGVSTTVTMGGMDYTLKQTGYPGWPEFDPPSIPEFIAGINNHGIDHSLIDVEGFKIDVDISASGGNGRMGFNGSFTWGDDFGDFGFELMFGAIFSLE